MENLSNEQFEHEMNIISNLKEVSAPNFFYARLKARMEKEAIDITNSYSLNPVIIICALTLFLFINSWLLQTDSHLKHTNLNQNIEALAVAYDQAISN
jgi:hypothetical protein